MNNYLIVEDSDIYGTLLSYEGYGSNMIFVNNEKSLSDVINEKRERDELLKLEESVPDSLLSFLIEISGNVLSDYIIEKAIEEGHVLDETMKGKFETWLKKHKGKVIYKKTWEF